MNHPGSPPPPPGSGDGGISFPGAPSAKGQTPWTPVGGQRTNVLAVVSFVMMFVFMPLAVILALIARVQIHRSNGTQKGMGWTTAVLVIASVLVALLVLALLATQGG